MPGARFGWKTRGQRRLSNKKFCIRSKKYGNPGIAIQKIMGMVTSFNEIFASIVRWGW